MSKSSILRYGAIAMASVGLAGVAAASTGSITGPTGASSHNYVTINGGSHVHSTNVNKTGVVNFNGQGASTGDVEAAKNTSISGGLSSGAASNHNTTGTTVTLTNASSSLSGSGSGSTGNNTATISGATGADSNNAVTVNDQNSVHVTNVNKTFVANVSLQGASSGDVSAYKNTTVGGLSSGDASNTSSSTTSVSVSN